MLEHTSSLAQSSHLLVQKEAGTLLKDYLKPRMEKMSIWLLFNLLKGFSWCCSQWQDESLFDRFDLSIELHPVYKNIQLSGHCNPTPTDAGYPEASEIYNYDSCTQAADLEMTTSPISTRRINIQGFWVGAQV